jgi:hypothetical protein
MKLGTISHSNPNQATIKSNNQATTKSINQSNHIKQFPNQMKQQLHSHSNTIESTTKPHQQPDQSNNSIQTTTKSQF